MQGGNPDSHSATENPPELLSPPQIGQHHVINDPGSVVHSGIPSAQHSRYPSQKLATDAQNMTLAPAHVVTSNNPGHIQPSPIYSIPRHNNSTRYPAPQMSIQQHQQSIPNQAHHPPPHHLHQHSLSFSQPITFSPQQYVFPTPNLPPPSQVQLTFPQAQQVPSQIPDQKSSYGPPMMMEMPQGRHSAQTSSGSISAYVFPPQPGVKQAQKHLKKSHTTVAESDAKLKEQAYSALSIPFDEYANSVKLSESDRDTTPSRQTTNKERQEEASSRERQRQVFGMVVLLKTCELSADSVVARNKIYNYYASICLSNGISPLSAASFGKLVRIVFPLVTTRRLGTRGQSKYHYCGIRLIADSESCPKDSAFPLQFSTSQTTSQNNSSFGSPYQSSVNMSTSQFSQANPPTFTNSPASGSVSVISNRLTSINTADTALSALDNFAHVSLKFDMDLCLKMHYPNKDDEEMEDSITLPELLDHLEAYDTQIPEFSEKNIDSLQALYKDHCVSIFKSLRYMHLNKLFQQVLSFPSQLSKDQYAIFVSPYVSSWIVQCDLVTYKAILKMLSKIALQKVPDYVVQQLKVVCTTLPENISNLNLPAVVLQVKQPLVDYFCKLVSRLIRVTMSTGCASKVLSNPQSKKSIIKSWQNNVSFDSLALRVLPCPKENREKVLEILTKQVPLFLESISSSKDTKEIKTEEGSTSVLPTDRVVEAFSSFLLTQTKSFPTVPASFFLLCLNSILTTALRDISLAGSEAFSSWWLVKCWIDEWMGWCAEYSGFLLASTASFLLDNPVQSSSEENAYVNSSVSNSQNVPSNVQHSHENEKAHESNQEEGIHMGQSVIGRQNSVHSGKSNPNKTDKNEGTDHEIDIPVMADTFDDHLDDEFIHVDEDGIIPSKRQKLEADFVTRMDDESGSQIDSDISLLHKRLDIPEEFTS
ncbi:Transcriptional repressor [Komagataella phaffii CBS 7435]|uniref:Major transcriptional repressor of DNA-damage-regulated genes n=2 Tax=Komagataella phaffii TaxID=460519 RepID=C4R2P9_KOMPG|nr:uncharacterized protein PAS_chr2-2_0153 [Komagataella phaffii GS115]AOA61944.1 GQ67_01192T0 [Komagataella phaffii]CAH2447672.1 Transcriptional repressor [Komagataella phaffii CBS 7435]AOA67566.1 GQ68_00197T0 [Komagataella phaffii GS115]CAY69773.1 Major transcriptional repressor of DNA-damage-regulated genes [Komagataella phaffii GS115]CCA37855.1 Transcriptional repressor [Komagataella phaffii CBS 7435]